MSEKEFSQHHQDVIKERNALQSAYHALDIKSKAIDRISYKKRGIDCQCTISMICKYHGQFYD